MNPTDVSLLNLILQGGSFALLAWYFMFGLDRREKVQAEERAAFAAELKATRDGFAAELRAERASRDAIHERCEEGEDRRAAALSQVTQTLAALQAEVARLLDRSDTHRPLADPPRQQRPNRPN